VQELRHDVQTLHSQGMAGTASNLIYSMITAGNLF